MEGIKLALKQYSQSEEGKTHTLLLPTVDKRLRDQALFEEEDIFYLQSPLFEKPLQVLRSGGHVLSTFYMMKTKTA